jgi:transposase
MWLIPPSVRIFLAREPSDMRRSFDGLCSLVRETMEQEPTSGHLFVFHNRRGDRIKMLYFDRTGLAIWYKRLEQGRFHWPKKDAAVFEMDAAEMIFLLEGIDLARTKRHRRFSLSGR